MLKNIETMDEIILIVMFTTTIIISTITYWIVDKILDKMAIDKSIEILSSFNYYDNVKKYMNLIFLSNAGLHSRIQVSLRMVNNFSSYKQFDYLIKYFELQIDEKTISNLCELKKYVLVATKKAKNCKDKRVKKYIFDDIPSLGMYYISPQGKSGLSCTLTLSPNNINELIENIDKRFQKQSSRNYQRTIMNKQIRQSILARDNWTCKNCGISIYDEPNLLLEVDHINPISMGGKTEPNNLQTLCWRCNREKSNKIFC